MSASATCTTTRMFRARLRSRLSLEPRPPARSVRARRLPPNLATGMLAEEERRRQREHQRKDQHRRIERDLVQAGNAGGSDGRQHAQTSRREQQSQCAAQQPEHEALHQQLPRETSAAGAERRPDGELVMPVLRAHEHEVRDVRAGDHEHDPDRAHQHPQHVADVAHQLLLERPHQRCRSDANAERSMPGNEGHASSQIGSMRAMSALALLHRDARRQPGEAFEVEPAERQRRRIDAHGQDEIRSLVEEAEACRHDADHHSRTRVDGDLPADDRRVSAESPCPIAIHEDDRLGRARRVVRPPRTIAPSPAERRARGACRR